MKMLLWLAFFGALLDVALPARAQFIGGLDGVSNSSTFENGVTVALPVDGWTNVSGTAQVFDIGASNGSLIGTTNFANYEVEYITGVAVRANTTYTLHFDMGFVAGIAGGSASYSYQLGTTNGGIFTPLAAPTTGTIARTGNMFSGVYSGSSTNTITTGGAVSGNILAVRWAQTSNPGPSDFFGFDNVTLAAAPATPAPVPTLGAIGSAMLALVLLLAGCAVLRRTARQDQ